MTKAIPDDGTCGGITANVANKKISFTANSNCYFYTTFLEPCQKASTDGYNAFQFLIKGPAGAKVTVEIQTTTTCTSGATRRSFYYVVSGITGSTQTITVPFTAWTGANAASVKAFVFQDFTVNGQGWLSSPS